MSKKIETEPVPPAIPGSLDRDCWAALAVYVERKKREARRKWPSRMNGPTGRELASYWEGQYVALVKLQRRVERIVKAQHNE